MNTFLLLLLLVLLPCAQTYSNSAHGTYLERLVDKKKIEVQNLLKRHYHDGDPLFMRMHYMASKNRFNITNAIRLEPYGPDKAHTMSIVVDMKRRSPTVPQHRDVVDFQDAKHFAELLAKVNVDALFINTEEIEYGGQLSDLKDSSKAMKKFKPEKPPACICKDLIIHPIQIAQALENGAAGVLLNCGIVGADLETLLDSCTLMGVEGIVEVHTPKEVDFALAKGATIFLVNMWDRVTGQLHPRQAVGVARMFPMNAVTLAAGDIYNMAQVAELGYYGYDGVVLGRRIAEIPDIQDFISRVHAFKGPPRDYKINMGFKAPPADL